MKKKYADLIKRFPILKYITHWITIITLFFIVWLLFFDTYSYFDHRNIDKEIQKLEENKAYYIEQIEADKKSNRKLDKMEEVERYAREKYFMKRENEDIYIIEIDEQYK